MPSWDLAGHGATLPQVPQNQYIPPIESAERLIYLTLGNLEKRQRVGGRDMVICSILIAERFIMIFSP